MGSEDIQKRITSFWSTVAPGYEAHGGNVPALDSEEYRLWIAALGDMLPPAPARVLDLATGTGFVALIAASLGHDVTGIDLAEPMLAEARANAAKRKLEATFQPGDVVAPRFPRQGFDAVTSRHLFWTLRDPDAALPAWRGLLKPGGRVVVIDGFWFGSPDEEEQGGLFESFYSREVRRALPGWRIREAQTVADLFRRAGFERVSVRVLEDIHRAAENPPGPTPPYAVTGFAV